MKGLLTMNNSMKVIKSFSKNSIFFKYLKKFTLIILIPFILLSCIFSSYYYSITNNSQTSAIYDKFNENIEELQKLFNDTERIFNLLSVNNELNTLVFLDNPSQTSAAAHAALVKLKKSLNVYSSLSKEILGIVIYTPATEHYFISSSTSFKPDFSDNCSIYVNSSSGYLAKAVDALSNTKSFAICYNFYSSEKNFCIISFIVDRNVFKINNMQQTVHLFDIEKNLIFSTDNDIEPIYEAPANGTLVNKSSVIRMTNECYKSYIQSCTKTKLSAIVKPITAMTLICIVISCITAFVLSLIISSDSYHMLHNIVSTVVDITQNDYANNKYTDEMYYIIDNIINLSNQNKLLEKRLITQLHELKKMQNAVLQVQFSPHFLFNTLNCINLIAFRELGRENQVSHTILLLSELLTTAVDTNQYMITIKDEISYCKKYIEIEAIKNKNSFDTHWETDNSILNCKTPKFILQPILENAFKHGIKYLAPAVRGKLLISVTKSGNDIVFLVQNNGPAIPAKKLAELNESLKHQSISMSGNQIGLANVNSRIKIIYGDKYSCKIDSTDKRTIVKITIPYTL